MTITTTVAITFVRLVHVFVIAYVIAYPYTQFSKNSKLERLIRLLLNVLYLVSCTSILLHWRYNNDACVLTTLEAWLRGKKEHEGFIYSIISPIYKFPQNGLRRVVRIGMFFNMSLVAFEVCKELASTADMAIIFV